MILVLGATGRNGRELVRELAARGAKVRGASRSAKAAESGGVEMVAFDYGDRESIRRALDGVELVFVVSPAPNMEDGVVEEARLAGVKRIVKLSVWKADREDYTFGRWHRRVEKLIESSGVPYTFLRPSGFMQNVVGFFAPTVKTDGVFFTPAGDARVAHVDVADIARAAAAVLLGGDEHAGKAYDLSGPEAITYHQIAATLSDVLGKPVRYVDPGADGYKKTLLSLGTPEAYADAVLDLNRAYVTGEFAETSPWVERLTGKAPRSFRVFAEEHAAAFA